MRKPHTNRSPSAQQTFFDQAERELRSIVGGDLSSRQFYGVLGVIHSLAEQAARKS